MTHWGIDTISSAETIVLFQFFFLKLLSTFVEMIKRRQTFMMHKIEIVNVTLATLLLYYIKFLALLGNTQV